MKGKQNERNAELNEFINQVRSDEAMQKQIGEAGSTEETADGIVRLAREKGYGFNREEVLEALRDHEENREHPAENLKFEHEGERSEEGERNGESDQS